MNFRVTTQEFCVVGGYTEDLEKRPNCQNQTVGACMRMGACPGQYDICSKACIHGIRVCVCVHACVHAYIMCLHVCVCVCVCACMHVH